MVNCSVVQLVRIAIFRKICTVSKYSERFSENREKVQKAKGNALRTITKAIIVEYRLKHRNTPVSFTNSAVPAGTALKKTRLNLFPLDLSHDECHVVRYQYWPVASITSVQATTGSMPFSSAIFINSGFSVPGLKMMRLGFRLRI